MRGFREFLARRILAVGIGGKGTGNREQGIGGKKGRGKRQEAREGNG
jgi:hypothetical protein